MGCDIHCYVEYTCHDSWCGFNKKINPGRNYDLFGALAGVRRYREPVFPLRGIPDDLGYWAESDYWVYVNEEDSEFSCTREKAERWVEHGSSKWKDELKVFVSNPDSHSHSWLTAPEFRQVLTEFPDEIEYAAVLAAMECFDNAGYKSRLVFWFDN